MKVVFDTNVLVAAFVTEGVCAKLLGRARRDQIRVAAKLISEAAEIVSHASMVSGICRDPDDDQILSCALSAKVDYLVTGDFDLLELKDFHGIRILTPAAFELLFED